MKQRQNGSAHVIVIVALIVIIFGLLGFVFYQNFIAKKPDSKSSVVAITSKATPKPASVKLVDGSIDKGLGTSLTFKYPETWSLASHVDGPLPISESDVTTQTIDITSPSGAYEVEYLVGNGGLGGVCDPNEVGKVASFTATPVSGFQNVDYVEFTPSGNNDDVFPRSTFYGLFNASAANSIVPGSSSLCATSLQYVISLSTATDLQIVHAAIVKGTPDAANTEYQQAKAILLSTTH